MKSRTSFELDRLIDEQRANTERGYNFAWLDRKSKVIAALIDCREKVDEITRTRERLPYNRDSERPRFIDLDRCGDITVRIGDGSGPGADAINRILQHSVAEERMAVHAGIRNPLR